MVAPFVAKRDTRGIVAQCLQLSDFLMKGDRTGQRISAPAAV